MVRTRNMECPSTKRQTNDEFWGSGGVSRQDSALFDNIPVDYDDFWAESSMYALDPPDVVSPVAPPTNLYTATYRVRKRDLDEIIDPNDAALRDDRQQQHHVESQPQPQSLPQPQPQSPTEVYGEWIRELFPGISPALPSIENRQPHESISNPFAEVSLHRHSTLRNATNAVTDENGVVDGYIKFRIRPGGEGARQPVVRQRSLPASSMGVHHKNLPIATSSHIPGLPPGFGKKFTFDAMDSKLMKFYVVAICAGRTLLQKTNGWLVDLAPMAEADECVKHALLALAAGYALDYHPTEKLRQRANLHYRRASDLLTRNLSDPRVQEVGKDDATDAVVGALRILWCDDIVQWELRRDKDREPRWHEAAQSAKTIMANTDPGYRYWHHQNVQCTSARVSNANMLAYVDIMSMPVTPLSTKDTERCHPWLLEGPERDSRKIYGGTGVCPKLLHMFGQITHLCALMNDDPSSTIIPLGARAIERKLVNFYQWSELSEGYASPEELLDSCVLNSEGQVDLAAKVTELTAEAWVQTARIYLQCRFFRLPRSHPAVQRPLNLLLRCIERMPCSGPLFTSQSPFFPVFVMGLMSYRDEDRKVVRYWFEHVLARAGARSSVPPVWRVLRETWQWLGAEHVEWKDVDEKPVGEREAWWELLVERLVQREGRLSLV